MEKTTPKSLTDTQISAIVKDSARQIWLAGLGAYSKAGEEGIKVFNSLVNEGEALENRIRKTAEDRADQVKYTVSGARSKLEHVFEERVARALEALGVPSDRDIQALSRQVEELSAAIEALQETQKSTENGKKNAAL